MSMAVLEFSANDVAALTFGGMAGLGLLQAAVGVSLLGRFRRRADRSAGALPPITVLKPLYGDEAMLEPALASFFTQDYPAFQIVFGVQNPGDPALRVVERLRARYPHVDAEIVIDGRRHGTNGKVGNLINMMRAARHETLVISDSDIHAPPATLRAVAETLAEPGVGLATALYTGMPASGVLSSQLGAAYINQDFLPGALMARAMGRQDCLGAIMALTRTTLDRIGGLEALADHVADDALLGKLVRAQGLEVGLIRAIPATTVPETQLAALFHHELRWARTVKSVAPAGFALSSVQFPLFWGLLMLVSADDAVRAWLAFGAIWLLRGAFAAIRHRLLPRSARLPMWALPLRDLLSIAVILASYRSNRVDWRGQEHQVMAFTRAELEPGRG